MTGTWTMEQQKQSEAVVFWVYFEGRDAHVIH